MDRQIIYANALPLDTDLLNTNKSALVGIAKLAHAIFGDGPFVNGLSCGPTSPASLNVQVQPGQVYQLGTLDATAYGSLAVDSHQVLQQGIVQDAVTFTCNPPGTAGQSISYLVQAGFQSNDTNAQVLQYYNSANPSLSLNGPGGNGASQPTTRAGQCVLQLVTGVAAASGSQQTPAASPGFIPLYVITVAQGQTQITAANISQVSGAPFITEKLKDKISQATADARYLQQYQTDARYQQLPSAPVVETANVSLAASDFPSVKVIEAASTVTLPLASTVAGGQVVTLKSITTGLAKLQAQGSDTIDGLSTPTLRIPYLDSWDVMSNGSNGWLIVRRGDANVGESREYNGGAVPPGWLLEDGSSQPRSTYSGLFDVISTTWGNIDGTHFNLPDKRGRVSIGAGAGTAPDATTHALGATGGSETVLLDVNHIPNHTHGVIDNGHAHNVQSGSAGSYQVGGGYGASNTTNGAAAGQTQSATTGISIQATGGGQAHANMQPYAVVNKIIKL